MRGEDQTALTRFCFHGIQENAQNEKKAKMQDQLDEHKARLASTQQHTTAQKTVHIKVKMTSK